MPLTIDRPSRTSATRRAITPSTGISCMPGPRSSGGITVACGTRPGVGLIDAIPQQCAGLRSDPPTSLPSPSGDMPEASALASPPDDPPAVTSGSHGLRVSPRSEESVRLDDLARGDLPGRDQVGQLAGAAAHSSSDIAPPALECRVRPRRHHRYG